MNNWLNLPTRIVFKDGSEIHWVYDSAGNKLRKIVVNSQGSMLTCRDYVDNCEYENNVFDMMSMGEGRVRYSADHGYVYNYGSLEVVLQ